MGIATPSPRQFTRVRYCHLLTVVIHYRCYILFVIHFGSFACSNENWPKRLITFNINPTYVRIYYILTRCEIYHGYFNLSCEDRQ